MPDVYLAGNYVYVNSRMDGRELRAIANLHLHTSHRNHRGTIPIGRAREQCDLVL